MVEWVRAHDAKDAGRAGAAVRVLYEAPQWQEIAAVDGGGVRDNLRAQAECWVRDALARLKPEDREVLTLSVWEQIAVAVASTPAAVRQRLVRARQRLREALGNRGAMAA